MIRVNGEQHPWREGMTVAELLEDLQDPQHYAVVRINNRQVSKPHFENTLIPDDSDVFLLPMVAGG
jgi:thiamine biosynthesis protein ThiS